MSYAPDGMHAFVQELGDARVTDHAWRIEETRSSVGQVLEAPYFTAESGGDGWWRSIIRFVAGGESGPRFNLPFDEQGNDALGLCTAAVAGVTIARGQIVRLRRGSGPLLRDLWLDVARLLEMDDFAVVGTEGTVIVACGMAPLVIGVPAPCAFGEWLASSGERMRELAPRLADRSGSSLRLEDGDTVEVRGIARPLSTTARTINLSGWQGDYRTAPPIPDYLVGDEEGTRLVIRAVK